MKKFTQIITLGCATLLALPIFIQAQNASEKPKSDCPAMAKEVAKKIQSDCPMNDASYEGPTFIGADQTQQQALFQQLSNKSNLSLDEQRQLLLVQLALLANSQETSLEQLKSLEKSISDYLANHKADAELMTAKGSAIALQSLHFQDNLGKMNFLSRKGMRLMDRAVKQNPNNLGARLLRGLSYANMPAFLNRASFAKEDLTLVRQHIPSEENPGFLAFVDHYLNMAIEKTQGANQ